MAQSTPTNSYCSRAFFRCAYMHHIEKYVFQQESAAPGSGLLLRTRMVGIPTVVDAEISESLDSTCPSKKGCQFVDASGGSSHDVGLIVASTSRVPCSARSWAIFCHFGTSSVWL